MKTFEERLEWRKKQCEKGMRWFGIFTIAAACFLSWDRWDSLIVICMVLLPLIILVVTWRTTEKKLRTLPKEKLSERSMTADECERAFIDFIIAEARSNDIPRKKVKAWFIQNYEPLSLNYCAKKQEPLFLNNIPGTLSKAAAKY